jgi:hypothetical protein
MFSNAERVDKGLKIRTKKELKELKVICYSYIHIGQEGDRYRDPSRVGRGHPQPNHPT